MQLRRPWQPHRGWWDRGLRWARQATVVGPRNARAAYWMGKSAAAPTSRQAPIFPTGEL